MFPMSGDNGSVKSNRPPVPVMPSWAVWVGAAIFPLLAVGLIWVLLLYFGSGTPQDRVGLDVVRTAGGIVVGTGGAIALLLTARRQRATEMALRLQDADLAQRELAAEDVRHDATERRITELYAAAVEQLGSEKAPVRLGGLYALERLAQDNPGHRQTVVEVLCAYLRMPDPDEWSDSRLEGDGNTIKEKPNPSREEHQVRRAAQHILVRHLSPSLEWKFWPGMELDLTGATLHNWNFEDCVVHRVAFSNAIFEGRRTSFRGVRFGGRAWFRGAVFRGDANFHDALFCEKAEFEEVCFQGSALFGSAKFTSGAAFDSAVFCEAAVFSDAEFGRHAFFGGVWFHEDVKLDVQNPESLRLLFALVRIGSGAQSLPSDWKLEDVPLDGNFPLSGWQLVAPVGDSS